MRSSSQSGGQRGCKEKRRRRSQIERQAARPPVRDLKLVYGAQGELSEGGVRTQHGFGGGKSGPTL